VDCILCISSTRLVLYRNKEDASLGLIHMTMFECSLNRQRTQSLLQVIATFHHSLMELQ
jgi:hypothetical protein